ncbi:MAG: hypothetical protein ABI808_03780 [Pseudonocardiales bacterium]
MTKTKTAGRATPIRPRRASGGHQPKHAPRVPFALLVGGLVLGGMCALLALNTACAANELARHKIAGQDSDVAARVEQVRNQVAASAAPGSLGQAAAALGMVPAGAPAFLKISANGRVVLLGSPAPATAAPPPAAPVVKQATHATTKPQPKTKPHAGTTAKAKPKTPTATPTPTTTLPGGTR